MALPAGSHPSRAARGQDGVFYDQYGNALVLASGTVTLDGSNPTAISTGLTTVTAASFICVTSSAPADGPATFTYTASGGDISLYAWENTSGTDPTLAASTNNTAVIAWMATGT